MKIAIIINILIIALVVGALFFFLSNSSGQGISFYSHNIAFDILNA